MSVIDIFTFNDLVEIGENAHDDAQDATTGVYENLPNKKATSNYTPIFM